MLLIDFLRSLLRLGAKRLQSLQENCQVVRRDMVLRISGCPILRAQLCSKYLQQVLVVLSTSKIGRWGCWLAESRANVNADAFDGSHGSNSAQDQACHTVTIQLFETIQDDGML